MKKKLTTKLGIVAMALVSICCATFSIAFCSAEELTPTYAVTYLDQDGNPIAADSLAKEGYTATADVYKLDDQYFSYQWNNETSPAFIAEHFAIDDSGLYLTIGFDKTKDSTMYEHVVEYYAGYDYGVALINDEKVEAKDWSNCSVNIEYKDQSYNLTLSNEIGKCMGCDVACGLLDNNGTVSVFTVEDMSLAGDSSFVGKFICVKNTSIVGLDSLSVFGYSFKNKECDESFGGVKATINGYKLYNETKIAEGVDPLTYEATSDCTLVVTYEKNPAEIVTPGEEGGNAEVVAPEDGDTVADEEEAPTTFAGKIKAFFAAIKNWFVDLGAKIKAFFVSIKQPLVDFGTKVKDFFSKIFNKGE